MPNTFLLTWNPDKFSMTPEDWEGLLDESWGWSCYTKQIRKGDRIFVARVGSEPRGIFASGNAESGSIEDKHWDPEKRSQGKLGRFVNIKLDRLIEPDGAILDKKVLNEKVSDTFPSRNRQWTTQVSGIEIPNEIAARLESVWTEHCIQQGVLRSFKDSKDNYDDEDLSGLEGGKKSRHVNYYERRPELRKRAIEHHGTACKVCGCDFGLRYGKRGVGFIEVHHLIPVSKLGEETKIDPKVDMTVLCSNCHRMAHRDKDKVLTVDELKQIWKQYNT
ncbi:MAG: HNH endonuclease [Nitrospirae bacterium]|nr:HNH endonuclease [Nitrospirota bacterium]